MDLLTKNIILSFFIMLFGFNLNAQFGSINVLTRDGENILVPICNIAYVYETPDGAELITDGFNYKRDDQENRILLQFTYDDVLNLACEYIKECSFVDRPNGERTAVSMCFVENVYEFGSYVQADAKDGRRLIMADSYIDIVNDMLCVSGTKPVNDIYLTNAQLLGNSIQLVMNTGTSWTIDLSTAFTDDDTKVSSGFVNGDCEMVLNMSDGSSVNIPLGNCSGADIIDTDNQTVDLFTVTGNQLCISLEDDNEPVKCVDISALNPDDQYIDILNFDGQNLCISLVDDGLAPICIDLSTLQVGGIDDFTLDCNTGQLLLDLTDQPDKIVDLTCLISDDQQITSFYFDPNSQEICIELENDMSGLLCTSISGIGTDDQIADQFQLIDNILYLSLEDDGTAASTVDLSGLVNSDPNTDDQVIQVFSFDAINNLLSIQIEDDVNGAQVVDLSALINNGTDTDDQCGTLTLVGSELTLNIDDCPIPSTVNLDGVVDDDQQLNATIDCGTGVLTIDLEDNPAGTIPVDLSCLVGGGGDDDQMVDLFSFDCNSNELSLSLEGDGAAPVVVDLTCIAGGGQVDLDYTLDCNTQILTLSIPGDPDGDEVIDLSCLGGGYLWKLSSDTPNDYDINDGDLVEFKTTDAVLSSTVADGGTTKTVYYSFINGSANQVLTLDENGMNPSWQDAGSIPLCPTAANDNEILVWDAVNEYYCPEAISTAANARNGLTVVNDAGTDYVELGGTLYKNTTVFGDNSHIMNYFGLVDFIVTGGSAWTLETNGQGILKADTELYFQLPNYTTTPDGALAQKTESTFGSALYTPYGFPQTTGADGDFLVYNDVTNQLEFMPSTNGLITFDITGETGTQTISTGDNISITGSNLISTAVSAVDQLDIFIDGTGAAVNEVVTWNGSAAVWAAPATSYIFSIEGDDLDAQTIINNDVLTFTGLGVLSTNVESLDEVQFSITPGNNNEVLTTVSGVVQWASGGGGSDNWGAGTFTARADGAAVQIIDEGDQFRIVGDGITATTISGGTGVVNTISVSIPAGPAGTVLSSDGTNVTWELAGGSGDNWGAGTFLVNDADGVDQIVAEGTTLRVLGSGVIDVNNIFSSGDNDFTVDITAGTVGQVLTTSSGGQAVWETPLSGDNWGTGTFQVEGDISTPGTVDQGEKLAFKTITGDPLEVDYTPSGSSIHNFTIRHSGGTVGQVLSKIASNDYGWVDVSGTNWILDADSGTPATIIDGYDVTFHSNDAVFTTTVNGGMSSSKSIDFEFIDGLPGQVLTMNSLGTSPEWADPSGGGESTTASNGLTLSGVDIKLGGALTEATTINGGTNRFILDRSIGNNLDLRDGFSELTYGGAGLLASTNSSQLRSGSGAASTFTVNSTAITGVVNGTGTVLLANSTSTSLSSASNSLNMNSSGVTVVNGSSEVEVGSSGTTIRQGSSGVNVNAEFLASETRLRSPGTPTTSGLRLTGSSSIISSPDAVSYNMSVQNIGIFVGGLPTSDPGLPGYLWNDSGTLKISL